jgi:hypothetical protein
LRKSARHALSRRKAGSLRSTSMGSINLNIDLEIARTRQFEKANRGDAKAEAYPSPGCCSYWRSGLIEPLRRFVAKGPRMLLDCAVRDACLPAHDVPAITRFERSDELVPITIAEFRPPKYLALCARPLEARFGALADLFPLELCERGEGGQEDIADKLVFYRQVLFGVRPERDAVRG